MTDLTDSARATISSIAGRYGLSEFAVEQMARAVANGGGSMAQFNIPELGGSGQWMAGGMTMVGDMFNMGLQATVQNLCSELSNAMAAGPFFVAPAAAPGYGASGDWWPDGLGVPGAVGGQNAMRYAYFPQARRVAVDFGDGSPVAVLDALDHSIGGWSQQQSGWGDPYQGVSFSSQYGQFALSSLPRVDGGAPQPQPQPQPGFAPEPAPAPQWAPEPAPAPDFAPEVPPAPQPAPAPAPGMVAGTADEVFDAIERLARLRDAGALTDDEFGAKKAELLARL
ncbi:SHOCT domain-containing protein [Rhodovulum sp. DZ06]|uniref:SHOCT domain-containing protein n=1 Tax=Rhodovulum sp. DZ06 TaxID=3425126 RepID=UPI003D34BC9F